MEYLRGHGNGEINGNNVNEIPHSRKVGKHEGEEHYQKCNRYSFIFKSPDIGSTLSTQWWDILGRLNITVV